MNEIWSKAVLAYIAAVGGKSLDPPATLAAQAIACADAVALAYKLKFSIAGPPYIEYSRAGIPK